MPEPADDHWISDALIEAVLGDPPEPSTPSETVEATTSPEAMLPPEAVPPNAVPPNAVPPNAVPNNAVPPASNPLGGRRYRPFEVPAGDVSASPASVPEPPEPEVTAPADPVVPVTPPPGPSGFDIGSELRLERRAEPTGSIFGTPVHDPMVVPAADPSPSALEPVVPAVEPVVPAVEPVSPAVESVPPAGIEPQPPDASPPPVVPTESSGPAANDPVLPASRQPPTAPPALFPGLEPVSPPPVTAATPLPAPDTTSTIDPPPPFTTPSPVVSQAPPPSTPNNDGVSPTIPPASLEPTVSTDEPEMPTPSTTPEPPVAEPVTPDAVPPKAIVPDPVLPDPAVPDSVLPDPAVPDPVVPNAAAPVPAAMADAVEPVAAEPRSAEQDRLEPEPTQPDVTATADSRPETAAAAGGPPTIGDLGDGEIEEIEDQPGPVRVLAEWIAVFVGAFLVAIILRYFVIQSFYIPSESMESTLTENDRVLVNKLSYRLHDVNRGDVIVFRRDPGTPGDTDDLIKRVIGLPGESVEIRAGAVYIDGLLLDEPYLDPDVIMDDYPSTMVPEDEFFVMGDNRDQSFDSRWIGTIPRERIVGRAFVLFWPLNRVDAL